jgi:hypothetical protein
MAALAAFALKLFIAACGLAVVVFLVVQPTDKYDASTVPDSLALSDLEGRSVLQMVLTWGTVLAATLATLLLRRMSATGAAPAPRKVGRRQFHKHLPARAMHFSCAAAARLALCQCSNCHRWPPRAHTCRIRPPAALLPPQAAQVKRALAWQLPPRAFFASWCGGLSLGEALLVLAWLALNGWWLGMLLQRNLGTALDSLGWQERVGK